LGPGKWEHVISKPVEDALTRVLGEPTTCPHGNPIPGSKYVEPDTRTLSEVRAGEPFTVTRITEELEFATGLLDFLEDNSLTPGRTGMVTKAGKEGSCSVSIDGHDVVIDSFTSRRILVEAT